MLPWWKKRVFYQIYPRSFKDSNGDGIGDLKGIISKLDYLKELGIGAVWLCPIYDSPNADMGYDIRDYEKIMSEFGDMDDFDELLEEMHKRDIKLIMDLVVNHSSDEHRWFIESKKSKDNPYRDFYIWRDGKDNKEPNNWSSFFTPSAWSYSEETKQWYLHLFAEKQPDLNWENPNLREEIYAMINRWFDKGVDGFRMDVITLISKNTKLPDGKGEGYVFSPEYFALQPKMHEYLRELRNKCLKGRDCMCVGEATFADETNANTLVGDGNELDLIFQFDLMDIDGGNSKWDLKEFDLLTFKDTIEKWQRALEWNTLFWGNHDQPRVVSRFGSTVSEELRNRSAKCLATAMYFLKGTPFIYQGEELGMTNYPFDDVKQLRDIESINLLKQNRGNENWAWKGIKAKGRDNARTPMQWNNSHNAGFTSGNPWIEVNPNYVSINAENEEKDSDSILNFYKRIIELRNSSDALINGEFRLIWPYHKQLFAYERIYKNKKYTIICNISNKNTNLPEKISGDVVLSNFDVLEEFIPFGAAVYVNDD